MEKWNGSLFSILFGFGKWQSLSECLIGSEANKKSFAAHFSLRTTILVCRTNRNVLFKQMVVLGLMLSTKKRRKNFAFRWNLVEYNKSAKICGAIHVSLLYLRIVCELKPIHFFWYLFHFIYGAVHFNCIEDWCSKFKHAHQLNKWTERENGSGRKTAREMGKMVCSSGIAMITSKTLASCVNLFQFRWCNEKIASHLMNW